MSNLKHGRSKTKIYAIWRGMHTRCYNKNNSAYDNYGGRGIGVCKEWFLFENFYRDMGDRPDGMSLERIDNDKDYSPSNCVWASRAAQSRNRRNRVYVTVKNETKTLAEWSEQIGISLRTIWYRLKLGWTDEEAITTPLVKRRAGIKSGEKLRYHQQDAAV